MKRYIEPSRENLLTTLDANLLNRNEEIAALINIIESFESAASIQIDGDWGSGKTFFVKHIELVLKNLLDNSVDADLKSVIEKDEILNKIKTKQKYLPIYYNAWECDNHEDSLVSIIYTLIRVLDKKDFKSRSVVDILSSIFDLFNLYTNGSIKNVIDAVDGDSLFDALKAEQNLRENIIAIINEILSEQADCILFIVDELDRCKPTYAINMLERIKHYFNIEHIKFIFSVNTLQLTNSIMHTYGDGFDANRYLTRFFDITFRMEIMPSTYENYIKYIGFNSDLYVDILAVESLKFFQFSLRDCNIFLANYEKPKDLISKRDGFLQSILPVIFLPYLVCLKIINIENFNLFITGSGINTYLEFVNSSQLVSSCIGTIISQHFKENEVEIDNEYIIKVYNDIFRKREDGYYGIHITKESILKML